jgi:DNA-binding winged helix-turn-helix (wHTH) protein/tetratricopeptide (TPR) repeat protein
MIKNASEKAGGVEPAYCFAGLRLERDGTLRRADAVVHLASEELAALQFLLVHAGQIVSSQQLKQALWGDAQVGMGSVAKCLSSLRARLEPTDCIQIIEKRGYRISVETQRGGEAAEAHWRLAILPITTNYLVAEHLGAAIAEETIARLANLRPSHLALLPRDSVFTLARRKLATQEIGKALDADLVLTGTLSAVSAHFRLRTEMVRVADGAPIWVDDLLVEKNRLAGLESELAERLFFRLGHEFSAVDTWPSKEKGEVVTLTAAAAPSEALNQSCRQEAYEAFLHGHHEWQTLERHRMQDGLRQLQLAIELDPTLLAAKTDLVQLCITQAVYGYMAPTVEAELVRHTAATIDDLHKAEAILPALGWINFHVDHNLGEALRAFSLSAHLHHSQWTTRARSIFALSRHRFDEAISLLRAAIRVDPFSPWLHNRLAWAYHLAGERKQSMEQIHRALTLFPEHEVNGLYGAIIFAYNGEAARGSKLAQHLTQVSPYFDLVTAVHAYTLACEGRKDEALAKLERLQWLSRERFVLRAFNPAVYVALGDQESAMAELRAAEESRCPWFFQALADPRLEPLRGQAEFERMRSILPRMEAEASSQSNFEI